MLLNICEKLGLNLLFALYLFGVLYGQCSGIGLRKYTFTTLLTKTTIRTHAVLNETSFLKCAVRCSESDLCKSFHVNKTTMTCYLDQNQAEDEEHAGQIGDVSNATMLRKKASATSSEFDRSTLPQNNAACVVGRQNVAFNKTTAQGPPSGHDWGWSSAAVDGNTDTYFNHGSCSHTGYRPSSPAWWSVDLEAVYHIEYIIIWNREDCCGERLSDFNVHVGNRSLSRNFFKRCFQQRGRFKRSKTLVLDSWSVGQFVRIEQRFHEVLTICEVKVYPRLC